MGTLCSSGVVGYHLRCHIHNVSGCLRFSKVDDGPAYFPIESGTFACVACANQVPHTPDCRICKRCKSKYCSARCQAADGAAGHAMRCQSVAAAWLEQLRQRQFEQARAKAVSPPDLSLTHVV